MVPCPLLMDGSVVLGAAGSLNCFSELKVWLSLKLILGAFASTSNNIIPSKNTCYGLVRHTQDGELRVGLTAVPSDVNKSLDFSSQFSY